MVKTYTPRGRYFEEFQVGDSVVSAGRTVTETDIVNFAGLSGDFTQIHTNVDFARQGTFGQRVAHGMLGLSIASGLLAQLGFLEGTVLALREITWKFSLPIYIGDTIHAEVKVIELKTIPRMGGGAVTLEVHVFNQNEIVVHSGKWLVLVASKP